MTKKKRLLAIACACVLAIGVLAGCQGDNDAKPEAQKASDGILTIAYPHMLSTLDTSKESGATVLTEISGTTETLVKTNSDFGLEPCLATEWKHIDDSTWQFKLREGVKFHDGTEFTGEAVKMSLERTAKEDSWFQGAAKIDHVDVIDDHTVNIVTTEPSGSVPAVMTMAASTIIAPSSFENDEFIKPVGTGYYEFESFDPTTGEGSFVRFDEYWGGDQNTSIEKRIVKSIDDPSTRSLAVQNGEVDIATDIPFADLTALADNEDVKVTKFDSARNYSFAFNTDKDYLAVPEVRKAILYAIDKQEIVEGALMGVGAVPHGLFYDKIPWNNSDVNTYDYDVEKAKQMLDDAGFVDSNGDGYRDWNGEDVTFEIATGTFRPGNPLIAQAVQSYIEELGIRTHIDILEWNAYQQLLETGTVDLSFSSFATAMVPSPSYYLVCGFEGNSGTMTKSAHYDNPELDALIAQCAALDEGDEKIELSKQAQEIIADDAVAGSIALYSSVFVMNANLTGFSYNPAVHDFVVPYSTDLAA